MMKKAIPVLLLLCLVGCKKDNESRSARAIEPSISGTWTGTMTINGVASAVELTLQQNNIAVSGQYTSDGISTVLDSRGQINGATTGPTFSLNLKPTGGCVETLQLGGQNNGTSLALNLIGDDCHDQPLRGEAVLAKQP